MHLLIKITKTICAPFPGAQKPLNTPILCDGENLPRDSNKITEIRKIMRTPCISVNHNKFENFDFSGWLSQFIVFMIINWPAHFHNNHLNSINAAGHKMQKISNIIFYVLYIHYYTRICILILNQSLCAIIYVLCFSIFVWDVSGRLHLKS